MAITIIHNWYTQGDINVIHNQLWDAFDLYKRYLYDRGYSELPQTRIFFRKIKFTDKLIVKIKNLPEPDALISAIGWKGIFNDEDYVFIVDGKEAILNQEGEVNSFKEYIENANNIKGR